MKAAYYSRANSYSKSYNAMQAEREGRYPATEFKRVYGIDPRTVVTATEWHHSSKFANRVNYYNVEDVMQALADMPYSERITKIKRGFKAYWDANKAKYLTEKLGNKGAHGKAAPFRIYTIGLIGTLALQINDTAQWGRAFRKALANGRYRLGCAVRLTQTGDPNFFHIVKA